MGRLPLQYAGKDITMRYPFVMPGELLVSASTNTIFDQNTFIHNIDTPFEIHRMIVKLTAVDDSETPVIFEPQPTTLDRRIRLNIENLSAVNVKLNKAPALPRLLMKENEMTWEWEDPYTIQRSNGFLINVDSLAFPSYCIPSCDGTPSIPFEVSVAVNRIRVEVSFQGFNIIIKPPTDDR